MRRLAVFLFLICACVLQLDGQKWRAGQPPLKASPGVDYPLSMHIFGIRNGWCEDCRCRWFLIAEAIIEGQKMELEGCSVQLSDKHLIRPKPGDFRARLIKGSKKGNDTPIGRKYELESADGYLWECDVSGYSE